MIGQYVFGQIILGNLGVIGFGGGHNLLDALGNGNIHGGDKPSQVFGGRYLIAVRYLPFPECDASIFKASAALEIALHSYGQHLQIIQQYGDRGNIGRSHEIGNQKRDQRHNHQGNDDERLAPAQYGPIALNIYLSFFIIQDTAPLSCQEDHRSRRPNYGYKTCNCAHRRTEKSLAPGGYYNCILGMEYQAGRATGFNIFLEIDSYDAGISPVFDNDPDIFQVGFGSKAPGNRHGV